jgi:predicted dienelactone hydrolase
MRTLLSTGLCAGTLLLALAMPSRAMDSQARNVGFGTISVADRVSGTEMPGYVFYPMDRLDEEAATWRGPYEVHATPDAPPAPGKHPLVVISHGHAGSALGHHDLAEYLAANGFIVATFEHPGDNHADASGAGQPQVLGGRAVQLRAVIHALLEDPQWRPLIDADRIGVAGFSAGGYTALLAVGAQPRFDRYVGYCAREPQDPDCELVRKLQADGQAEQAIAGLQAGILQWGPLATPEVKAAFAMAPFSLVFDEAGTAGIDKPVFLYYAEEDKVVPPRENAQHLAPLLKTLARVESIPKAGHYVFLAPCSDALAKEVPDFCTDLEGVDRAAVHARINADALAFFRQALDVATP